MLSKRHYNIGNDLFLAPCGGSSYLIKDEYTAPNVDDPTYKNFEADSLVFSLFGSNSQQSSLRGVSYKNKSWDVLNHFFFVPSKDMAEWADESGLDATYAEANAAPDRHMVKALAEAEPFMSDEAKDVTEKCRIDGCRITFNGNNMRVFGTESRADDDKADPSFLVKIVK